jgi:TatD DNase family protein
LSLLGERFEVHVLIDSHAHLASEKFEGDRDATLDRAWAAGLSHVVIIGETDDAARDLAATDPRRLSFTAGVHPHEAATFNVDRDVARIRALVRDGAVAIGECGLDYYYDHSPRERQMEAFQAQLDLAAEVKLPVVVHTRLAEADTIAMMTRAADAGVLGVLHCFTGSLELAQSAIGCGWYVSISGIATFKTWERNDVVMMVPDDRLLVETDAPYLAPVPHRGKRNEPAFLPATVAHLAELRGVTAAALASLTASNAIRFFGLSLPASPP